MPSLALIFHLVDCVTHNTQGQVGLESAKQAVNWCEYLETHARRVYGLFDGMGMRPAVALSQKLKMCLNPTAKTDETQKTYNLGGEVGQKIGFVSFGSDLTGQIENLENNANDSFSHVDSVILANSDDYAMEYEDGVID